MAGPDSDRAERLSVIFLAEVDARRSRYQGLEVQRLDALHVEVARSNEDERGPHDR